MNTACLTWFATAYAAFQADIQPRLNIYSDRRLPQAQA